MRRPGTFLGVSFSILFSNNVAIIKGMLSKKAKDDFKKIIKKDYGADLTDDQAEELGVSLLRLIRVGLSALARDIDEKEKAKEKKAN